MTDAVAWMDGQGNLYQFPDDADRGQTMRPLYLEKPTHPNLEQVLNSAGFYRKREWEGLTDDFYYIEGSREAERISIPPKRKWVGLTTEEILGLQDFAYADDIEFVNHIEALLKEKNHG
jgi:hypothetical protein